MYMNLHPMSILYEGLAEESIPGSAFTYPIRRDEISLGMFGICPSLDNTIRLGRIHEQDNIALPHNFIAEDATFSLDGDQTGNDCG